MWKMYTGLSGHVDLSKRGESEYGLSKRLLGLCILCKECPVGAIEFFLGADIGGNGSVMNVTSEGDILHWNIHKTDGSTQTIDIDRRNANQY